MTKKPTTVAQFLATLPKDRRDALQAVRRVILKNLDTGYREGFQSGAIAYFVPHSVYPPGYHCDPSQPLPYVGLASQKNHMGIYLFCTYTNETEHSWFQDAWLATGKKLDMGKSCVRFKKLEDVALDVLGKLIKRTPAKKFIAYYEAALGPRSTSARKATKKKSKTVSRKSAKKVARKKARPASRTSSKKTKARVRKATKRAVRKTATRGLKRSTQKAR